LGFPASAALVTREKMNHARGDVIDITDLAKKLVDIQRDDTTTTSELLRRIKTVTLRIDALSGDGGGRGITAVVGVSALHCIILLATISLIAIAQ
jgi:hypothetical protein